MIKAYKLKLSASLELFGGAFLFLYFRLIFLSFRIKVVGMS